MTIAYNIIDQEYHYQFLNFFSKRVDSNRIKLKIKIRLGRDSKDSLVKQNKSQPQNYRR